MQASEPTKKTAVITAFKYFACEKVTRCTRRARRLSLVRFGGVRLGIVIIVILYIVQAGMPESIL